MASRRFSSRRFLSTASSTGRLTHSKPAAPFQTHFYSGALRPASPAPVPVFDPAQGVCDLLWHRYLLTIVDDNDRVVHFVSFPLSTERYTPALPVQRQKLSTFMELPAYRVVIMPYGVHERLRSHLRCEPHRKAARFGFRLLPI